MEKQWSNSVFRFVRNTLGLEFNVQVLLSAELIARGYYGLLARQAPDAVIRAACLRITRDEVGHIAFHVDFFGDRLAAWPTWRALLWRTQFQPSSASPVPSSGGTTGRPARLRYNQTPVPGKN